MKRRVLLVMMLTALGCSTTRSAEAPPRGFAIALGTDVVVPGESRPSPGHWIYIQGATDETSGVYWCQAVAGHPICTKAEKKPQ